MAHRKKSKRSKSKTILRLPDLEQSKNALLHSLGAASSQESYGHAIDEFIGWYCSEPRLAFNRTVVLRYRFFLEQKNLAPSTINVRLAAVRRLAHEEAGCQWTRTRHNAEMRHGPETGFEELELRTALAIIIGVAGTLWSCNPGAPDALQNHCT